MTGKQIREFKVFEEKTDDEKGRLIEKIVGLWRNHAKDYRENLQKYADLLKEAKELGLKFKKLKKSEIESYPKESDVFYLETEEEVRKYLGAKNIEGLRLRYEQCENVRTNYSFRSINTALYEARYQLSQKAAKERAIENSRIMQMHNLYSPL